MKRIFITGSTGFIGEALTKALAKDKDHVLHLLVRSPEKARHLEASNVVLFKGTLEDKALIATAIESCEEVYHLAAYAQAWSKDPATFFRINVGGTENILAAARNGKGKRVVIASTGGVLGASGNGLIDETAMGNPQRMTLYEQSKLEAEALAREHVRRGMHTVIVNPTRVFGPGPQTVSNGETLLIKRFLDGNPNFTPGNGDSTGSYVYIDDVVNGIIAAMAKGRPGERYLLSGENASYNEFFQVIAQVSGQRRKVRSFPLRVLLLFARFELLKAKVVGYPPLITPPLVRKYAENWSFSCEKAKRELGYTHLSLEEAVRRTVAWIEQNYSGI